MKPIILASDHGGFELKQKIKRHLGYKDYAVEDVGTDSVESVDYPVFAKKAVERVLHHNSYGIFICGSGIGICVAANRNKGIHAALIQSGKHSEEYARLSREHNNANVLCLGGRFIDEDEAVKLVDIFLETKFDKRHAKRVEMLDD